LLGNVSKREVLLNAVLDDGDIASDVGDVQTTERKVDDAEHGLVELGEISGIVGFREDQNVDLGEGLSGVGVIVNVLIVEEGDRGLLALGLGGFDESLDFGVSDVVGDHDFGVDNCALAARSACQQDLGFTTFSSNLVIVSNVLVLSETTFLEVAY